MKPEILFVDDEKEVLNSIRRLFMKKNWILSFAESGEEGLEILQDRDIQVIVSDMRMPGMDGAEFLRKAMTLRPLAVRIVLSGYADSDTIMEAINEGAIWRFISKPWNKDDLRVTIDNGLELYRKDRERLDLIDRLNRLNDELDQKVRDRTWLLEERSTLLHMHLEDSPVEDILKRICQMASRICSDSSICLRTIHNDLNLHISFMESLDEEALRAIEKGESLSEIESETILLTKSGTILGALSMALPQEGDRSQIIKDIKSIATIASLVLFQEKTLEETHDLLNSIDLIMEHF